MRLRHGSLVLVVVLGALPDDAGAESRSKRLRLAPHTAVPGQVVTLRGPRVKTARVTIGRKRATVVRRRKSQLRVIVPRLRPGSRPVVLKAGNRRLRGKLRLRRGFTGSVGPTQDRARARSGVIGPAGGTVAATGADGARYELSIPAGALAAPATITITPLRRIRGLPLTRAGGVQLAPDGLAFARPATLKITRKRAAPRGSVAFTYLGGGRGLELGRATRSGTTLTLPVEHFSGAGGGTVTVASFMRYVARLLIGQLTLTDVDQFLHELQVVESLFGDFCLTEATCQELLDRSADLLEAEAGRFRCGSRDPAEMLDQLRSALFTEGQLRLIGRPRTVREADDIADIRRCMTNSLVAAADGPARSDAVGVSALAGGLTAADRTSADVTRDGEVWNAEWDLFVAGIAAQQGFSNLQAQALSAFETGLQTVLDDGKKRCDESFPEGSNLLEKGQKLAEATQTLINEFADAVADCKPKIFVTSTGTSVEVGKTRTFAARSNDGDATFDWRASDGTIDASGKLTAPDVPGTVTVTAASHQRPVLTGSVTVTVSCPAGQVEFAGECRTIAVTVSPPSVALAPGATQAFSAAVSNTIDPRVTWTATCGSVTPTGLYTAPGGSVSCTIRARSVADPSKSGTAIAVVGGHVELQGRSADLDVTSSVGCDPGTSDFETKHDEGPDGPDLSGPFHLEISTSASGSCGSTTGTTIQDSDLQAGAAGTPSWSLSTNFTGGHAESDENLIASYTVSSLTGTVEAIGQDATITCSGSIGGAGSLGVVLGDDLVVNRTEAGAFSGSLTFPADGDDRSLLILARHGGEGSLSSTVTCKFDRPSVVVPD